ncbi:MULTISPECIES: hypothetical protein [Actinoalloteichus]|uniref:hypothetical protein n=1 Tax=Actinoalloteichus TaxID=65496 RepID=UPI0012FC283B|nr:MULTISPECIES: hypothetical protein [Actinoalloteichus]
MNTTLAAEDRRRDGLHESSRPLATAHPRAGTDTPRRGTAGAPAVQTASAGVDWSPDRPAGVLPTGDGR